MHYINKQRSFIFRCRQFPPPSISLNTWGREDRRKRWLNLIDVFFFSPKLNIYIFNNYICSKLKMYVQYQKILPTYFWFPLFPFLPLKNTTTGFLYYTGVHPVSHLTKPFLWLQYLTKHFSFNPNSKSLILQPEFYITSNDYIFLVRIPQIFMYLLLKHSDYS